MAPSFYEGLSATDNFRPEPMPFTGLKGPTGNYGGFSPVQIFYLYSTWESLKDMIEYLRKKYRKAKKVNNSSGRDWASSPFYNELDKILGKPGTYNPINTHEMRAFVA